MIKGGFVVVAGSICNEGRKRLGFHLHPRRRYLGVRGGCLLFLLCLLMLFIVLCFDLLLFAEEAVVIQIASTESWWSEDNVPIVYVLVGICRWQVFFVTVMLSRVDVCILTNL